MYVCMYVCMDGCMYVWMHACMDGWMDGWMYVWMYVYKYVCVYRANVQMCVIVKTMCFYSFSINSKLELKNSSAHYS